MQVEVQISGWGSASAALVAVNGVGFHVDVSHLIADARLVSLHWDGRDGEIRRTSSVPGKFDIEHFADEARVLPFLAPWQAAKDEADRRAAEAERVAAEQRVELERQQAEAAALAEQQAAERLVIASRVDDERNFEPPAAEEPGS
jgi:hypothetical protein